jgi:hypothetical protein
MFRGNILPIFRWKNRVRNQQDLGSKESSTEIALYLNRNARRHIPEEVLFIVLVHTRSYCQWRQMELIVDGFEESFDNPIAYFYIFNNYKIL